MPIPAAAVKAATALLSNEKTRKGIGWLVVTILSPVIIAIVVLFVFLQGGSKHNTDMVYLCFYGGDLPAYAPAEYQDYILDMRRSFLLLDDQIAEINEKAEEKKLDAVRVKSIFFSLYFGLESPSRRDHRQFTECFVTWEEPTREDSPHDTVPVPIGPLGAVYARLAAELGIHATEAQKANAMAIYRLITGHDDGEPGYDPELPFVGIDGFTSPVGPNWRSMLSSEFGWRDDPLTGERDFHRGLDMTAAVGHPIYAALDGVVISVGTDPNSSYGYHVKIDHGGGFVTLYAHNSRVLVSAGQQVTAGQQIAGMGETGRAKGVHLHFEIQISGELQDPRQYMP